MSERQLPYCPAWLDELELKPTPFRVYLHLCRRAGKDGRCYPSAPAIAATCRINRDTVWPALKALEKAGLIARIKKRFGTANTYLVKVPVGGDEHQDALLQSAEKEGRLSDCQSAEKEGHQSAEKRGRQSAEKEGRKGTPMKVLQRKGIQSGGELPDLPFQSEAFTTAWREWTQHRREIKKPLTPTSTRGQFKKLLQWGEAQSIASIARSIENGWQGIFEPNGTQAKQPTQPPRPGTIVANGQTFRTE